MRRISGVGFKLVIPMDFTGAWVNTVYDFFVIIAYGLNKISSSQMSIKAYVRQTMCSSEGSIVNTTLLVLQSPPW